MNNDYNDYLMHYGIKGQQWGIRRYQNDDGTLTPEGKKRYGKVSKGELAEKADYEEAFMKSLQGYDESWSKRADKFAKKKSKYQAKYDKTGKEKFLKKIEKVSNKAKADEVAKKEFDKMIDWGREYIKNMDLSEIKKSDIQHNAAIGRSVAVSGAFGAAMNLDYYTLMDGYTIVTDRSERRGAASYVLDRYFYPREKKD